MRNKSKIAFRVALLVADYITLVAAFVLAYIVRVKIDARPLLDEVPALTFLGIFLLIIPLWLVIYYLLGLYSEEIYENKLKEWSYVFIGSGGGIMIITLVDFFIKAPIYPARLVIVYGFLFSVGLVIGARLLLHKVRRLLFAKGIGLHRVLLVGNNGTARQFLESTNSNESGYEVVAAVGRDATDGLRSFATFSEATDALEPADFDEIVQTQIFNDNERNEEIVLYAHRNHLGYRFYPASSNFYGASHKVHTTEGIPFIEVRQTALSDWGRIVKRTFDITLSLLALILLSPLLLIIAVLIKVFDPGPVFYSEKRLRRYGDEFKIYKFRTMQHRFNSDPRFKNKSTVETFAELGRFDLVEEFKKYSKVEDDPRVSKVGRFLRRTSLDELPQLYNVLKGELSLVGPRPIDKREMKRREDKRSAFLSIKPGLTGLWQVSGRNETTYEKRVELELYYVQNWSPLLDIKILFKTLVVVLTGKGAY